MVYFSFDDGPNSHCDTTARLLDVLGKYRIRALFCLLGENVECNPDLARRIYDEGHSIVNHGYSGKWSGRMKDNDFRTNLVRGEAAISAALGHEMEPKLYRPHGGFYSSEQEKIIYEADYSLVPGSIRIYDGVKTGSEKDKAVRQLIKKVEKKGGGMILLHDGMNSHLQMEKELVKDPTGAFNRSWIPDAVEEIIIALLGKGFILNIPEN